MSDLIREMRQMALPDPYSEYGIPNWAKLMSKAADRIEELESALAQECAKTDKVLIVPLTPGPQDE